MSRLLRFAPLLALAGTVNANERLILFVATCAPASL
jgi:hypothetical protein